MRERIAMRERGSTVRGKGYRIHQKVDKVISLRRYARGYLQSQWANLYGSGLVYMRGGLIQWAMMELGGLEMAYKKTKKKKGKGKK